MPLLAIILAMGSSFATHASITSATRATVTGYITPLSGPPCSVITACSNVVSSIICTDVYQGNRYQAFGKVTPSFPCDIIYYELP